MPIGTEEPTERVIVHPHPDVRGRSVEICEYRDPIRMANDRWTYMPIGFSAWIDGRKRPGRCRTKEAVVEGIESWIDFLNWDEAGRPWPPR
jgi:hypothetical protein